MKKLKQYIPITLLVAGLGLGFNVGCAQNQENTEETRIVRSEPEKNRLVGYKLYKISNIMYVENDNKSFEVNSKVEISNNANETEEFYVAYYCNTDIEGKFYKEVLSINKGLDHHDRITTHATKNGDEFQINQVVTSRSGVIIDIIEKTDSRSENFFKFGKEKLQLYSKLFNIEEKKRQAKGKNLYRLLDKFDITELTAEDFGYDHSEYEIINIGKKEKLKVSIHPDMNYSFVSLRYDRSDKVWHSRSEAYMSIRDSDSDGKTDCVRLENTEFEREKDGNYKYIRDLYTEEQVKNIFKDADQKLELTNKIKRQAKIPERENYSEEILKEFE